MNKDFAYQLKDACTHRGVAWGWNGRCVVLDGKPMETMRDAEDYLERLPRNDL